ncbi:alpha/beta hydrolase [Actinoplanes sp. NPDC051494]|uniref:alpha/beta hydrolase n=1 Tax=Actinoplanes sp. NPDC051494 TaxID=3363907 RepID=UPI0037B51D98
MTTLSSVMPSLVRSGPERGARAVVLFLHGGQAHSTEPARRGLAYLRMVPFARAVRSRTRGDEVAVWLLRYRLRGWNAPSEDPVTDARWALDEARRLHPGAPIVLVGHSMGGRTALRLAGGPGVAGVCALAPWIERGEPAPHSNAPILIAHGDGDRVTDPALSAAYAARVGASFVPVPGETHALLRRPIFWTRLVTGFVASATESSFAD